MATNLYLSCQSWSASAPFETNHVSAEKVRRNRQERPLWPDSSPICAGSVYNCSLLAPNATSLATQTGFWTDSWQDSFCAAIWGPFVKNNAECPTGGCLLCPRPVTQTQESRLTDPHPKHRRHRLPIHISLTMSEIGKNMHIRLDRSKQKGFI